MDPTSIITQVNGDQTFRSSHLSSPAEQSSPTINEVASAKAGETEIIEIAKDSKENHFAKHSWNRSSSNFGSRFISQLLCCFGIGHTPEYTGLQQQEQQQELIEHDNQPATSNGQVSSESSHITKTHLLVAPEPHIAQRICAVIDLDETLVHSSFRSAGSPDYTIEVEVDGVDHQIFVLKRPYANEFLARMGELFECVLFTASLGKYADPVTDLLDTGRAFKHRLFREACVYHCGSYVKDLSTLGRPVDRCVIIDNSPASFMFNVENAICVRSWWGDPEDTELRDLLPYLEGLAAAESVSDYLRIHPAPQAPGLSLDQDQVIAQMRAIDE